MEKIVRCKRCNAILKAEKSRKLGYGAKCYKIMQYRESKPEIEVNQEIAFLKMEIHTLKMMIRNISVKGSTVPIERIKRCRPEQKVSGNEANYGDVVIEMKEVFEKIKNGYKHLKPAFPNNAIIVPPVLIQVSA